MPLALGNVLTERELNKLCRENLKYSSLVSSYRRLTKEKLRMISEENTSFVELLMNSGRNVIIDDGKESVKSCGDLRSVLTRILSEKIFIGLIAVDKIPIDDIVTTFLHMDSKFASNDLILEICHNDSRLAVKGKFLTMSQCMDVERKCVNRKMSVNSVEKMRDHLIRHFCKSRPELLKGLQLSVEYKDILKLYEYWSGLIAKDGEFLSWLLDLAWTNLRYDFTTYKENIYRIISFQIVQFVTASNRNIGQIVDNFCFDKPSFIHNKTVKTVVSSFPRLMKIVSQTEVLDKQVVTIVQASKITGIDDIQGQANAGTSKASNDCASDFDLPHDVQSRVRNVLTLRATFHQVLQIYNIVCAKAIVQTLVKKYGCFLRFLIELGRVCKPAKLGGDVYGNHLKDCAVQYLMRLAKGEDKTIHIMKEVARKAVPQGLVSDDFLEDAFSGGSGSVSCLDQRTVGANSANETVGQVCEISDNSSMHSPIADLESPRIIHLLTRQPRFAELSNTFAALPEVAVQTLARSSVSFFEWTISLCKRVMPYDAEAFESHLKELVQMQVAKMHSTEHCQMTVQHVHNLLCDDKPMLLSPNFISYCLEQPGSSFCIYQSWIYLRTGNGQQPPGDNVTSRELLEGPTEVIDYAAFIEVVRMSTSLQQIISVTNCISKEKRDDLLKSGMCWYEFIENNSTRQDRTRLASLLVADVDRLLAGTVKKLADLGLNICNGSSRFITIDILDEILRQHTKRFALSRKSSPNCCVARVRSVEDGDVRCVDSQEKMFLENVLLCFPSWGFCEFATILQQINEDGSSSHINVEASFLECFFLAFPMLFYLDGNSVVLTCMALDSKLKYSRRYRCAPSLENGEYKQRGKKRINEDSLRSKRKRKKDVFSSATDHQCDVQISPRSSDESPDSDGHVKEVIENLLPDLVGDMTMSILQEHGGRCSVMPVVKELVSLILGPDEASFVEASMKYLSMFKRAITGMIKRDSRFETVSSDQDKDVISEVMVAEDGVYHNDAEVIVVGDDAQVREVTSTSVSPIAQLEHGEAIASQSVADDVIKLTPPRPSDENQQDDQFCISSTGKDNNDKPISFKELSDAESSQTDDISGDLVMDTERKSSDDTDDINCKPAVALQTNSYVPSYGSLSSGSSAHKYIQNAAPNRDGKAVKDRVDSFRAFTRKYLGLNAGSCPTEMLIDNTYRRFRTERFARSRLAFEAYMFDFIVTNSSSFSLTGSGCEVGVSKVTFKRAQNAKAEHALRTLMTLIKDMSPLCAAYLSSRPNTRATIDTVTQYVVDTISKSLEMFPETEKQYAVRCLTLVSMIRNLKLFCFAVTDPVVYLRGHKEDDAPSTSPNPDIAAKIKSIIHSERLQEAMLLMASIVKKQVSPTHKKLRELWQAEAPKSIANVFGTGISFTLAMRKYSFLFPPAVGGEVSVNANAIEVIRKGAGRRQSSEMA